MMCQVWGPEVWPFGGIREYCPDKIDIPGIVLNYFNTHAAFYQASDQISDPALQYYI